MAHQSTYRVQFRRRREGKTDYSKRLKLLKSGVNRLVVRVLNNQVVAQLVAFDPKGDKVLAGATSLELKKFGWKGHRGNASAAYLTGFLCAKRAATAKEAVLDIGLSTPVKGSNVFAALKGCLDGGMSIAHSDDALPKEERIIGKDKANFDEMKSNIMKG